MELGSATPKGREVEKLSRPFFLSLEQKWNCSCVEFGHTSYSVVDGFIVKEGIIKAVYEFKLRKAEFDGSSIINRNAALYESIKYDSVMLSKNKVDAGQQLSKMLRVPFLFICAFSDNDKLGYVQITDDSGNLKVPYRVKVSNMPATINGYSTVSEDCYIPVSQIKII